MGLMMPALMVPPGVMMVAPRAMTAKLLWTIFGLDDAAAGGGGIGRISLVVRVIVIVGVIVPDASHEHAPEVAAMGEVVAAETGTTSHVRTGAGRAALIRRAATESGMSAVSATATISAAATPTATAAATNSSNFDRKPVGRDFACSRGTRIEERRSFGAIAHEGRQCEERCRHKAQQSRRSSERIAREISNPSHACSPPC